MSQIQSIYPATCILLLHEMILNELGHDGDGGCTRTLFKDEEGTLKYKGVTNLHQMLIIVAEWKQTIVHQAFPSQIIINMTSYHQ